MRAITSTTFAATVAMLILAGCASPLDQQGPATSDARWRMSDVRESTTRAASPQPAANLDAADDVDDYVRVALAENPRIRAAELRVKRMGARVPQMTSLDDPMLEVAPFGEMAETAAGQVGLMTGVSQRLPWPGKLDTRGEIAKQDVAIALTDLRQARLEVIAATRQAFWSYYLASRSIETTQENTRLLQQFQQVAEAEYRAGSRMQADVLRAAVELTNLEGELVNLQQQQLTARAMLNQMMNRPAKADVPLPPRVQAEVVAAELYALLNQAAATNPAIERVQQRMQQFRQQRKLAKLARWPDVTISGNYNIVEDEGLAMSPTGDDQWWVGFGINLPIWAEKYEAAEREAVLGRLESASELAAERNRIAFEVQDAFARVQAKQRLVELFGQVMVPQARQAVDAAASGYRAGTTDFLTLVDNWRQLVNYQLMADRALVEMEQAVADLERVVGQDVSREAAVVELDEQQPAEQSSAPAADSGNER